ncbi:DUF6691 family protein [Testudinibacter sp. TR-2022]|uniref:DUF6691 family protein n=1 Tax=Testudinibacter sp. TR-2022 TaxID=2585029 RepID=UPI0011191109|nr:DUF6691 family protein [Testudinibacter sp. TR-2022]TNH06766.1 YeeE/YedE family protein [Pasteurellaceae bacterium Phil11]TNH22517.1 YeeE/YedE family protein [Testudinibacter sp. TR-2022]TNH28267.1 YeeE/YedE family protein [Testudinibacter sp. TR-2022]
MIFGIALLSGFIFGLGLVLSQMTNPMVVQGFLDIFGQWQIDLLWVMLGALSVTVPLFLYSKTRHSSVCGQPLALPKNNRLDKRLIIGAILFGIGWGMVGICPAPALVQLTSLQAQAFLFVGCMWLGMQVAKRL